MIKILWDQCEVAVEVEDRHQMASMQGYPPPKRIEQCREGGEKRTFADGHQAIMCGVHWAKCTGIVDSDGAKHTCK
jgi:hypothetical protein